MAQVQSNNREITSYCPEVSFGTLGSPANFTEIPKVNNSLQLNKEIIDSAVLSSDRSENWSRHGNYDISGTIQGELGHSYWDDFIAASVGGTWTANVLQNGDVAQYFAIHRGFLGLDTPQHFVFSGCAINRTSYAVNNRGIVSVSFDVIGASVDEDTSPPDASIAAYGDFVPFTHIGSALKVGGSTIATGTSLTWEYGNNIEMLRGIGSPAGFAAPLGEFNASGTLVSYFTSLAEYNVFKNEAETEIEITLTDGTNTMKFEWPRVKFNSARIPNGGGSGQIMATIDWHALKDGFVTKITRSA